jgi:hypothetical protein
MEEEKEEEKKEIIILPKLLELIDGIAMEEYQYEE